MGKKGLFLVGAALFAAGVISCGGGGGGSSSDNNSSSNGGATTGRTVEGGVYSSVVANATVCLEDNQGNILLYDNGTQACAQTDANGTFSLAVPPNTDLNDTLVALYVYDQNGEPIKIGETAYTNTVVNATANLIAVTPLALADNDTALADDIGASIHALGGDLNGNATLVDMGQVDIESVELVNNGTTEPITDTDKPIEYYLKEKHHLEIKAKHKKLGTLILDINPTNATAPVTCKVDKNHDGKPDEIKHLRYDVHKKKQEWEKHIKELELEWEKHHHNGTMGHNEGENENGTQSHNGTMGHNETYEYEQEPKDYSYIISGEIIAKEIPKDLKIRITPDVEQVDGEWGGIVCKINPDGSFGDKCVLHGNIKNFNNQHQFQIIIFQDLNNDWRFNKDEENTVIWSEENAPYDSWKKIEIN